MPLSQSWRFLALVKRPRPRRTPSLLDGSPANKLLAFRSTSQTIHEHTHKHGGRPRNVSCSIVNDRNKGFLHWHTVTQSELGRATRSSTGSHRLSWSRPSRGLGLPANCWHPHPRSCKGERDPANGSPTTRTGSHILALYATAHANPSMMGPWLSLRPKMQATEGVPLDDLIE